MAYDGDTERIGGVNNAKLVRVYPSDLETLYPGVRLVGYSDTSAAQLGKEVRLDSLPHLLLVATRDISPGDEILLEYQEAHWEDALRRSRLFDITKDFQGRIDLASEVYDPTGPFEGGRLYRIRIPGYEEELARDTVTYSLVDLNAAGQIGLVIECEGARAETKLFATALQTFTADAAICTDASLGAACEQARAAVKMAKKKRGRDKDVPGKSSGGKRARSRKPAAEVIRTWKHFIEHRSFEKDGVLVQAGVVVDIPGSKNAPGAVCIVLKVGTHTRMAKGEASTKAVVRNAKAYICTPLPGNYRDGKLSVSMSFPLLLRALPELFRYMSEGVGTFGASEVLRCMSPEALEGFMNNLPATMPKIYVRDRALTRALRLTNPRANDDTRAAMQSSSPSTRIPGDSASPATQQQDLHQPLAVVERGILQAKVDLAASNEARLNAKIDALTRSKDAVLAGQMEELRAQAATSAQLSKDMLASLEAARQATEQGRVEAARERRKQELEDREARKQERAAAELHEQALVKLGRSESSVPLMQLMMRMMQANGGHAGFGGQQGVALQPPPQQPWLPQGNAGYGWQPQQSFGSPWPPQQALAYGGPAAIGGQQPPARGPVLEGALGLQRQGPGPGQGGKGPEDQQEGPRPPAAAATRGGTQSGPPWPYTGY
jgi:hypothetical protein